MDRLFLVCALISLFCRFANAYSRGAPPEVCVSMAPNPVSHDAGPQTTDPPYMIQVDKTYYNKTSKINVTVKAIGDAAFNGILIQAREMGKNKPLGKFTVKPEMTQNLDCTSSGAEDAAGAITHREPLAAKMLTFQWEPASTTTGNITFLATIVQTRKVYWVRVSSAKVQDKTARETVKTTPKDNGATSITATAVIVNTAASGTTSNTNPNTNPSTTPNTTPNNTTPNNTTRNNTTPNSTTPNNTTPNNTTPNNTSSTPTGAMETTTKDSGAISNATYSITLIILAISAKLFI